MIFFFYVGINFNFHTLNTVLLPALILALIALIIKPIVFRILLRHGVETKKSAWEIGMWLGQVSEFSLLIAYLAASHAMMSSEASYLIQATVIITFIISSYVVSMRYATPTVEVG